MNTPPATSPWIADVDIETFRDEVVERSLTMPVVVDFWAEWCGPCKTLGPHLERLAVEGNGRFFLAKVDVDKNPELAQMFQVQSIPMVLAVVGGQPVDGFQGVQPEAQLREFLDRIAPGGPAEAVDDTVERARALAEAGDAAGARALLAQRVADEPADAAARVELATLALDDGDAEAARGALDGLAEDDATEGLAAARARLELVEGAGDLNELRARVAADPADLGAKVELGKGLVASGASEEGLEALLEAVTVDRQWNDQIARKTMLEVFEALGEEHPLTEEFRRRLQMVLF